MCRSRNTGVDDLTAQGIHGGTQMCTHRFRRSGSEVTPGFGVRENDMKISNVSVPGSAFHF